MSKARSPEQAFWPYVHKTRTCWLWSGRLRKSGHGVVFMFGQNMNAMRASWMLHYGDILPGLFVCHKCPNKACVRPSHLYLGTPRDNGRDGNRATLGAGTMPDYARTLLRNNKPTMADVFWRYVDRSTTPEGCWPWTAQISKPGYGHMRYGAKTLIASRVAYMVQCGPIPDGYLVCHTCDNRSCCRGDHLFAGTAQDNSRDMMRKGRKKVTYGDENPAHKVTSTDVQYIRQMRGIISQGELGKRFGITQTAVKAIQLGHSWGHLPFETPPQDIHSFGERTWSAKLSEAEVVYIRGQYKKTSARILAEQFSVSRAQITAIQLGKKWKHIPYDGMPQASKPRGEDAYHAKLTTSDVLYIRAHHQKIPTRTLAQQFGVSSSYISKLQRGLKWQHLE